MADTTSGLGGPGEVRETDGRRLRRARNRMAAVEALIDLYAEGHLKPSAAEIAERAGLSPRSLFRYFDDIDDLVRAGIEHRADVVVPLVSRKISTELSRADRIAALVALRIELYGTIGKVGRVARMRSWNQPVVAENLAALRRLIRRQTRDAFAPELDSLDETERRRIVSAIDVLTMYEAIDIVLIDQAFTLDTLGAALIADIDAILPPTR